MLREGLYQDFVNLFVVKYLLCEVVTGASSKLNIKEKWILI